MVIASKARSVDARSATSNRGKLLGSAWWDTRVRTFGRSEEGSVTAFSLFIFMMMLFVGGMAVDLMRFETRRAALQATLDTATLAATNLHSDADAEQLVKDIMAKRGYDPALTMVDVQETRTGADPANNIAGQLAARSVRADYDLDVNTIFMPLLGIESLGTASTGGAKEGMQSVEISLVVDISGSMDGQKMTDLKAAAKNFVSKVIDPARSDLPVTISVIPFNHTVVVPDSLLSRLNTQGVVEIPEHLQAPYSFNGKVQAYPREAQNSKCVRFYDDVLMTTNLETNLQPADNPNYMLLRAITPTQQLTRMSYYDPDTKSAGSGGSYDRPADDYNRRCDPTRSAILPFETSTSVLDAYIGTSTTGLQAGGNTSNDTGLKWGVALLDPAFRPVIQDMVDNNLLPAAVAGRPFDYNPTSFMKVLVLMTDGANTTQYDLDGDKKRGPSRVWYSEEAADDANNWEYGYFVEMPDNSSSKRWLHVRDISTNNDGVLRSTSWMQSNYPDLRQMTYTELYDRFSERAVSYMFRDRNYGDNNAYNDHYYAEDGVVDGGDADERMTGKSDNSVYGICDAAKVGNDILVYTIAFQAGDHAESVMRDCATSSGYYFNAQNGTALNQAFEAIAGQITTLRLTQ